jgi:CheY-like chemotaxis protein
VEKDPLHILLVDDDATDRELFADALESTGKKCTISEASNGEEALRFLASSRPPDLILLDLNMPVKDGRATLKELKQHEAYRSIPVFILSTSSASFDVVNAYENGANLFLVKPLDYKGLVEMLSSLLTLFSKYVTLSQGARS